MKSFIMNTCYGFSRLIKQINEMASIPVMIGGVLNYTTAFVGGSSQSIWVETSAEEEKKKHDLAV